MRIIYITLLLLWTKGLLAQSILNGSFENNLYSSTYCSFHSYDYNEKMNSSNTVQTVNDSSTGNLFLSVINEGCILDNSGVIFGETPPHGLWYISLLSQSAFLEDSSRIFFSLGVSLALSETLKPNKWYKLSYYIKAFPESYTQNEYMFEFFGNPIIQPIEVEVGVSTSENNFGTAIHISEFPEENNWLKQTVVFKAEIEAEHITCRPILTEDDEPSRHCTFLDNFVLEETVPIKEVRLSSNVKFYPNPTKNEIFITSPQDGTIQISNLMGQEVIESQKIYQGIKHQISLSHISKGIYLSSMKNSDGQFIHLQQIVKK